ncbi:MAG: Major Facilitator Superfamily protein [Chthonomonadaceae bacterium]|nr:Major Facilitator Superfamily protein [Chthonomonadaceae bacterium]
MSSESIESTNSTSTVSDYWVARREKLFWASCIALIVTAMSFAIRGSLIAPLGKQFELTNVQLGIITGTAFWGFAITTVIGGWLCDVVGMGRLLALAFIGHTISILTTVFAGAFGVGNAFITLFLGTLAFGLGNGLVEAACNPLIATLYPEEKIKRLNRFHMWFPGGIVIGGLVAYAISTAGIGGKEHNWQIQMLTMVIPLAVYGFMFFGKEFPKTERSASGVSMNEMFKACLTPLYLVFLLCMVFSSATELVTGQWAPDILSATTGAAGILILVFINGLMAVGRAFAGDIVHRISPVAMLIGSAGFSAAGMLLLSRAANPTSAYIAAFIFAVGVCFFWPTMLGVVSERFPRTGALGMSIMGGIGMISTSIFLPIVGKYKDQGIAASLNLPNADPTLLKPFQDAAAGTAAAGQWAKAQAAGGSAGLNVLVILPVILLFIFLAIFFYDKARGGYKKEILVQNQ